MNCTDFRSPGVIHFRWLLWRMFPNGFAVIWEVGAVLEEVRGSESHPFVFSSSAIANRLSPENTHFLEFCSHEGYSKVRKYSFDPIAHHRPIRLLESLVKRIEIPAVSENRCRTVVLLVTLPNTFVANKRVYNKKQRNRCTTEWPPGVWRAEEIIIRL